MRGPAQLWLLAAGLLAGAGAGCIVDPPRGLSCGDGWVDTEFEACDPADPLRRFAGACRERGFVIDARCDPQTCEILDSDADCTVCGDGLASGTEACDGDDVRDELCPGSNLDRVGCTDACTLDYEACPQLCGDGVINGDEECDPLGGCFEDDDCSEGRVCYQGDCIRAGDGVTPLLACSNYEPTAELISDKAYASGTVAGCTSECIFDRTQCSFCGDGELDGSYFDFVGEDRVSRPAEVCDGTQADPIKLASYCRERCFGPDVPVDPGLPLACSFNCEDSCLDFEDDPGGFTPGELDPIDLGCCLPAGAPCPIGPEPDEEPHPIYGELPCCSWVNPAKDGECSLSSLPPIQRLCPQ